MEQNRFTKLNSGAAMTRLPSGRTMHVVKKGEATDAYARDAEHLLVIDDRDTGNPSFQIVDSYAVHGAERMGEILDALIAFDRENPSERPWLRTADSLMKEWKLHNLAYRLHIYRKSSADVDLDNRDEGKGYLHFFVTSVERVYELIKGRLKRLFKRG